jgi:hypothetical protein
LKLAAINLKKAFIAAVAAVVVETTKKNILQTVMIQQRSRHKR